MDTFTKYDGRIDALLSDMTLEEKLGQLTIVAYGSNLTGPEGEEIDFDNALKSGHIGGIQNIRGVDTLLKLQKTAVEESRLGIPLIFPSDIIHGTEVVFPVPLAEAASWDLEAIEKASRIAAIEATAQGINMNYAPMADISRDPRWGRVIEGAGEDPYLTSQVTRARVRGYQGSDLSDPFTMAGCVKHFAAYGAAEAGRDYNVVDMSERRLREVYLPAYKAAVDEGVCSVMAAFNELNGVPSSCNSFLLKDILRKEWGFEGFVIADYTSVYELINHGVAEDHKKAAGLALNAGLDVDLISQAYLNHTKELIDRGDVTIETVDRAVKHILRVKYALGLMDDPYRYLDKQREKTMVYKPEYREAARNIAAKSIVLLKNENSLLPLSKETSKVALIGPFADNSEDPIGAWAFGGSHYDSIISLLEGFKTKLFDKNSLLYAPGCSAYDKNGFEKAIQEALLTAQKADVIIAAVGEPCSMEGEAASKTGLDLPGAQLELLQELSRTGKPVVAVVLSGRPMLLEKLENTIPAIVQAWHLGHESGNAICDVLFGDHNPSGKLPISFPRSVGQIPVYYSDKPCGRPFQENYEWCTHYLDSPNTPLYPFGYGLSYSVFDYSAIELDKKTMKKGETIQARVKVKNRGPFDGTEIVQLYIGDVKASVTRPVKELKAFKKLFLKSGEEQEVLFSITEEELKFYDINMQYQTEPGEFKLFIGTNSRDTQQTVFFLK